MQDSNREKVSEILIVHLVEHRIARRGLLTLTSTYCTCIMYPMRRKTGHKQKTKQNKIINHSIGAQQLLFLSRIPIHFGNYLGLARLHGSHRFESELDATQLDGAYTPFPPPIIIHSHTIFGLRKRPKLFVVVKKSVERKVPLKIKQSKLGISESPLSCSPRILLPPSLPPARASSSSWHLSYLAFLHTQSR